MSIFGGGCSDGYSHTKTKKIEENLHILQQNQNLQSRQIQGQFTLLL